jgi:hypothetical protein
MAAEREDPGTPLGGGRRGAAPALFAATAVLAAAAVLFLTYRRLFAGIDLHDASFSVLVPWRWALGDRPFVNEENLAQISGFLEFPFVKAFAVVRGHNVTGLVLYTRHLYLLLMLAVAAASFLAARRLLRWPLALVVSAVFVGYLFWQTPELTNNTMAAAFLTLGAALGLQAVMGWGGRGWALASGACFGLAAVAYPTLAFVMPFIGVFLAFALGRRSVGMVAELAFAHPPDPPSAPTGPVAWRVLSAWAVGGALVIVPVSLLIMSFGVHNLQRCWAYTMGVARGLHQLGGAAKAVDVVRGFWGLLWSRPYLIVAALLVYIVFTKWPRLGRGLLLLLPVAMWFAGRSPTMSEAGFVIVYAFLTPYLFLFVPRARREAGAKLLYWVWAPSVVAGAMTAFTSAAGYLNAAVGLLPALLAGGVLLAWSLEATGRPEGRDDAVAPAGPRSWPAMLGLVAVLAVLIAFQVQFLLPGQPGHGLTARFSSGPWWGIAVTPERRLLMDTYAGDLAAQARPGDQLLVYYRASGYYLYWRGPIAANSYWLSSADPLAPLPQSTVSYYRRHRLVPTLVVHLLRTSGFTDAELQAACGGLGYPPVLVRPTYAFQRMPADESTATVLARLPRVEPR